MAAAEIKYKVPKVEKGYANWTLYVNLSMGEIKVKPVDQKTREIE